MNYGQVGSYALVTATAWDAMWLAKHARHADAAEWDASVEGGLTHLKAIVEASREALTLKRPGRPEAYVMAGIGYPETDEDLGKDKQPYLPVTWMLAAEGFLEREGLHLMQNSKPYFEAFFKRHPVSECWSHVDNKLHHRWLEWMGYHLHSIGKWGWQDATFHQYRMGA